MAERIDYARRLESIEAEKARQRMSDGGKGVVNLPHLKTRDEVASKVGIGSGEQYRKEKAIVDNKELLDPSDFAEWDEGKLSTNKAFHRNKIALQHESVLAKKAKERQSVYHGNQYDGKVDLASNGAKSKEEKSSRENRTDNQLGKIPRNELVIKRYEANEFYLIYEARVKYYVMANKDLIKEEIENAKRAEIRGSLVDLAEYVEEV